MPGKSRTRKAPDAELKTMFQALEARPVPDVILSVVDQLDGAEEPKPRKAKRQLR
jgi:hypothetical protein